MHDHADGGYRGFHSGVRSCNFESLDLCVCECVCVYMSLYKPWLSFLLDKYLEIEWLDHTVDVVSFLSQMEWTCFLNWLTKCFCCFTILRAGCDSFSYSTYLPMLDMISLLNFRCSNRCRVVSHCGFIVHFSNDSWFRL